MDKNEILEKFAEKISQQKDIDPEIAEAAKDFGKDIDDFWLS